ncbi:MAG TPA: DUF4837 family protein [Longimicrobiales bacterium]|nr:DUF4837 family protein [Longimicrobiales bacterium]
MQRPLRILALPLLATALACDATARSPVAYGRPTAVIVVADSALWSAVEDSVRVALEPLVFTVRDERAYEITYVKPSDPSWNDFQMWRQVMAIGTPQDPWMTRILEEADTVPSRLPGMLEVRDVWARGQVITAVVLPEEEPRAALQTLLPQIRARIQQRFRSYVLERMFVSGMNERLRDRLGEEHGFSLIVPDVYQYRALAEDVHLFRNDFPDVSTLVRSILVTWRAGAAPEATPEAALAWRDSVVAQHYQRPMETPREPLAVSEVDDAPGPAIQVQGIWQAPEGEFPGGGPFITQVIACPEQGRTYLLDAWLYAPGKDKYEYMLQLEALLGTFRCGSAAGNPERAG